MYCPNCRRIIWKYINHLRRGSGCASCNSGRKRVEFMEKEEIITLFIKTHGEYYDYSLVTAGYNKTYVTIICPIHGEFTQTIRRHREGRGCLDCHLESTRLTSDECQQRANKMYKDISVLTIIREYNKLPKVQCTCSCEEHPSFVVRLQAFNEGSIFCVSCRKTDIASGEYWDPHRYTLDQCREKGNKIHKNKYTYLGIYIDNEGQSTLIIKCPIHGEFHKRVRYHLGCGHGCLKCVKGTEYTIKRANKYKENWLKEHLKVYTLYCFDRESGEEFYKIGVTKNTIQQRYHSLSAMPYEYKIIDVVETNMYDGTYLETQLHKDHAEYHYVPKLYFGGAMTECVSKIEHIDLEQINFDELKVYSRKRKEK